MVCGHIHHAEITDIGGIRYMNCGDWVESCTALVEDENGQFKILRWVDELSSEDLEADVVDLAVPEAA